MEAIKDGELGLAAEPVGRLAHAAKGDEGPSEELLALGLRGLLAKKPQQRLRVRDLRRDAWMTESHATPLPAPAHGVHGGSELLVHGELRERLREAVVQHRGTRALEHVTRERKDSAASAPSTTQRPSPPSRRLPPSRGRGRA